MIWWRRTGENIFRSKFFTAEGAENAEMISELNKITQAIIASAVAVHRELGFGLLESAYEACLTYELIQHGLAVERQK